MHVCKARTWCNKEVLLSFIEGLFPHLSAWAWRHALPISVSGRPLRTPAGGKNRATRGIVGPGSRVSGSPSGGRGSSGGLWTRRAWRMSKWHDSRGASDLSARVGRAAQWDAARQWRHRRASVSAGWCRASVAPQARLCEHPYRSWPHHARGHTSPAHVTVLRHLRKLSARPSGGVHVSWWPRSCGGSGGPMRRPLRGGGARQWQAFVRASGAPRQEFRKRLTSYLARIAFVRQSHSRARQGDSGAARDVLSSGFRVARATAAASVVMRASSNVGCCGAD